MTRQIFAAEINFQDTPAQIRERFDDTEKNVKRLLVTFKRRVQEVYILANRQRFTVYIVHEDISPLTTFFHDEHSMKGYVQYYYNSGESVAHLMATASGLLSPVKGDARILSELIRNYEWASACSCIGLTLDNTLSKALEVGKAVRTETGIDKFCASVVETGIELLYNRFQNLHKKNFLIVGTGKLARLVLTYLTKEGLSNIVITGPDTIRVAQLSKKFKVRAVDVHFLDDYLALADIIIGVAHDELEQFFPAGEKPRPDRKTRVILDFGVPPNFDMRTVEKWAEESYNLDDLRRLQPSPLESFGGLEAAWRMVVKASNDFVHVLQLLNHSPVLTAYLARQFTLKNGDIKVKPKRTLRSMLFRKTDNDMGAASVKDYVNARVHINNHLAENGLDIVRNVKGLRKFRFLLSEN